jgi:hypothetical protein
MAISARRSAISGADLGAFGRKSIVPAILVLRPSVQKRLMVWIPDSPAMSRFQFSVFPTPSEVMSPLPVMTTNGRPYLSFIADIPASIPSVHWTFSTSARPSPRQWPTLVTTACVSVPSAGRSKPLASWEANSAPRRSAVAASATFMAN